MACAHTRKSFARKWTSVANTRAYKLADGPLTMDTKLDVPLQVRELVVLGVENSEAALALFFEAVAASSSPMATDPLALLRRVVAVKFDYARKVARATDVKEATAFQFAYCRAQVEITLERIRIMSDRSGSPGQTLR